MEEVKVEESLGMQVRPAETAEQSSHSDDDGDETGSEMYTEDEDAISVNGDGDKKKKKVGRLLQLVCAQAQSSLFLITSYNKCATMLGVSEEEEN